MDDMTDFEKFASGRVMSGMELPFARDAWKHAKKYERDRCAKILNGRAKLCAEKAGESEDEKDRIDLRAMAWTFSVIEQEIIEGDGG